MAIKPSALSLWLFALFAYVQVYTIPRNPPHSPHLETGKLARGQQFIGRTAANHQRLAELIQCHEARCCLAHKFSQENTGDLQRLSPRGRVKPQAANHPMLCMGKGKAEEKYCPCLLQGEDIVCAGVKASEVCW